MTDANDSGDTTSISRRTFLGSTAAATLGTAAADTATAHTKPVEWTSCDTVRINVRVAVAVFTAITYYPSDNRWESWYRTIEDCSPGFEYTAGYDNSVVEACWCFDKKHKYYDNETQDYDYEYYRENKRKRRCKRAIRDYGKCKCHDRHRHKDKHEDDYGKDKHRHKKQRRHLVIGGGGGRNVIDYSLRVSGTFTSKSSHGGQAPVQDKHVTMDPEDHINGQYAAGSVAGGYDAYWFEGRYENAQITGGNAKCWVDGERQF